MNKGIRDGSLFRFRKLGKIAQIRNIRARIQIKDYEIYALNFLFSNLAFTKLTWN